MVDRYYETDYSGKDRGHMKNAAVLIWIYYKLALQHHPGRMIKNTVYAGDRAF